MIAVWSIVVRFNLSWVGRWLVSFSWVIGRCAPRPAKPIWLQFAEVIRLCPETPAPQVGQARLQALLAAFPRPTAKLTGSAWKRFWEFLKSSELEVAPIEWGEMVFAVDSVSPAGVN